DDTLPIRRKPWRKTHAGEIADDLALASFDIVQIDARIALPIGHVGDLLRRWREPRRQNKLVAAGEITDIGAVLIHDREPFDAPLGRPGLIDEYDPAVEIAALPGQALVDCIGDDMCDAPPIVGRGEILLAVELLPGEDVPQSKFRLQATIRLT